MSGEDFPWHVLQYEPTTRLRARLLEQSWSAAYINKHLVALCRVLKEAWRLRLIPLERSQRAGDLAPERTSRKPAGQHIPPEVIAAILDACDDPEKPDNPAGIRDKAISPPSTGSGSAAKDSSPSPSPTHPHPGVDRRARPHPGALFSPLPKGGRARTTPDGRPAHMTGRALRKILLKRISQAAEHQPTISGRSFTPHDFRRTFIGDLLDEGVDLTTARALVGHSSPATTARYDRRPKRTRRDAVNRLRLPTPAHPQPGADQ